MLLQDHPFWSKLLLPSVAREIAEQIRSHAQFNRILDPKGHEPFRAALIEHLTPLIQVEAQEELERPVTKMDDVVDYWFTTAFGVYPKKRPALATTVPDPDSPLGQRLAARLGKWRSAVDAAREASRPKGPVFEKEHIRINFMTKKGNSREEALIAEALAADEEYIETEARRRVAENKREAAIHTRMAELYAAEQASRASGGAMAPKKVVQKMARPANAPFDLDP